MKVLTSVISVLAMMGSSVAVSTVASAQTYAGTVTVYKGQQLDCAASVELESTPGKANVHIGPPEPNCASLTITSNDRDYTLSGGVLTIQDLYVQTITPGDCSGDLSATIDSSGNLVVDATLNPVLDSNLCYISGTLYEVP